MLNFVLAAILAFACPPQEDELAALRARVSAAERENRDLKKRLAKAEAAGFAYSDDAVSSAVELAKFLPDELSPRLNWDAFKRDEALKVLSDEFIGKTAILKFKVKHKRTYTNREFTKSRTGPQFGCQLTGEPIRLTSRGYRVIQVIDGFSGLAQQSTSTSSSWPTWNGDEALKSEFEKIRGNAMITIEGKISAIQLKKGDRELTITIQLSNKIFSEDCLNQ